MIVLDDLEKLKERILDLCVLFESVSECLLDLLDIIERLPGDLTQTDNNKD